jgi:hypothetical protein
MTEVQQSIYMLILIIVTFAAVFSLYNGLFELAKRAEEREFNGEARRAKERRHEDRRLRRVARRAARRV